MYRKAILNRRWTNLRGSPSNGPKTTSVNQQGGELVTLELLLDRMEKVRAVYEPQAFMPAIQTASSLGNPGISVQKMGLIVNAALMSPLLADDGTQGLILDGY